MGLGYQKPIAVVWLENLGHKTNRQNLAKTGVVVVSETRIHPRVSPKPGPSIKGVMKRGFSLSPLVNKKKQRRRSTVEREKVQLPASPGRTSPPLTSLDSATARIVETLRIVVALFFFASPLTLPQFLSPFPQYLAIPLARIPPHSFLPNFLPFPLSFHSIPQFLAVV